MTGIDAIAIAKDELLLTRIAEFTTSILKTYTIQHHPSRRLRCGLRSKQ
jgi:hypothetical protein